MEFAILVKRFPEWRAPHSHIRDYRGNRDSTYHFFQIGDFKVHHPGSSVLKSKMWKIVAHSGIEVLCKEM
jgi:hypothetical protein